MSAMYPRVTPSGQFILIDLPQHPCICTRKCDCPKEKPQKGVRLASEECPKHNSYPQPHPDCLAEGHFAAHATPQSCSDDAWLEATRARLPHISLKGLVIGGYVPYRLRWLIEKAL